MSEYAGGTFERPLTEDERHADTERLYIDTHDNARDWTRQPPMSWGDVADLLSEVRALRVEVFEQSCWIQTLSEESADQIDGLVAPKPDGAE